MKNRLAIILFLGFSSGLPINLITSTLQAWFADANKSVLVTGMLSLIGLPYLLRGFLGPFVDRYSFKVLGKRRSWILLMHGLLFLGINFLGSLSPNTSINIIATTSFIIALFSAFLDAAIDAHRAEYLPVKYYGLGNALAVSAYRIAMIVSGGFALYIASKSNWHISYHVISLFLIPGIIAILISPEPSEDEQKPISNITDLLAPIKIFFQKEGIWTLVLFTFFYKLGESFTTSTSGIIMSFLIQGIGFSLDNIALVNKVVGVVAIIAGGIFSGVILTKYSLYKSLMSFGFIQAITNSLFVTLAIVGKNISLFIVAVAADNFAAGMGTTALIALFMRVADKRYTATNISIFIAIAAIPRIISGPLGAVIQSYLGWVGMYELSVILALIYVPFLVALVKSKSANNIILRETPT